MALVDQRPAANAGFGFHRSGLRSRWRFLRPLRGLAVSLISHPGLTPYQLPTNLRVDDKRGADVPCSFCRPSAWIIHHPLVVILNRAPASFFRPASFAGWGGCGVKDLMHLFITVRKQREMRAGGESCTFELLVTHK